MSEEASTPEPATKPATEPASEPGRATLQGQVPSLADPAQRDEAMDQAFDYRGDVTLELADGRVIEGYVFDRRRSADGQGVVRVIPSGSDERVTIAYQDITRLTFSGRDSAAGKSWETWVRKYHEKKARGEAASIESESLD